MSTAALRDVATHESTSQATRAVQAVSLPLKEPLGTVPRPVGGERVVELEGLRAGGLDARLAEWSPSGGTVLLTGTRPFMDLTAYAGFRSDGTLDGTATVEGTVRLLGLNLAEARWSVAEWDTSTPLPGLTAELRGNTLVIDAQQVADTAEVVPASGIGVFARNLTVELTLPDGADGDPHIADVVSALQGWYADEVTQASGDLPQQSERPKPAASSSDSAVPVQEIVPPIAEPIPKPVEPSTVELIMQEAPKEPEPAAQARGAAVAGAAASTGGSARSMPSASETTDSARGAVEEPAAETIARAQEAVASELGERPAPSPEIVELAERIRRAIRENRPEDEDQLLRTDPTREAENAGAAISGAIESQAVEVSGAYDQMSEPAQGEPTLSSQPAPAQDPSVPGMGVSAATAAPDPVPDASRTLAADVEATDTRISESGIDTRVTREIPDGPFKDVRSARGELGELADRTPAEIAAEEQASLDGAQAEMAQLQLQAMAAMRATREGTVGDVGEGITDMTAQEELTRESVSERAQAIFDSAQQRVDSLLEPLSRTAMQRWETGLARLSREFNDALTRVQRWIEERHSGVIGTLVSIGDSIFGLPGWVTREHNRAEREFGDGVADLLIDISRDVNTVVLAAQAVIQTATTDIDSLFTRMEEAFPEWAAQERARFNGMLDDLNDSVADAQTSFVRDVRERAITAVNEAHATVEARREEAGGLIGKVIAAIGEFIDDPTRAIINGLLRLVGITPGEFWALLAQIDQVIDDIAADPENFINNLVAGVKLGFAQFFDNFPTHLITAFWNWLFSGLQGGARMPTQFDPLSLMTWALELMGITWPNVREILVRHLGPEAVELLEAAWGLLSVLIERGPEGIVEMVKEMLSPESIVRMILDAAINYLVETLIVQVALYLFSLLNPAGAIAQAIKLIYKVCAWIFRNAARIFSFVQAVIGGLANVVAGNIAGMASTVERALVIMMVVAIDFLASLLGLNGLPDRVAEIVTEMRAYVLSIVERIIVFLIERARALLKALGLSDDENRNDENDGEHDDELGTTVRFSADGESHRLYFQVAGDDATLMLASTPSPINKKIAQWRGRLGEYEGAERTERATRLDSLEVLTTQMDATADTLAAQFRAAGIDPNDDIKPPNDDALEAQQRTVSNHLQELYRLFGEQDEAEILRHIATELPARVATHTDGVRDDLQSGLDQSKYVALDAETATPVWDSAIFAEAARTGASAAARIGTDPQVHMRLISYFTNPAKSANEAASDAFWTWALTQSARSNTLEQSIRRAFADAWLATLRTTRPSDLDPIDTPTRDWITRLRRDAAATPWNVVKNSERIDPLLGSRVKGRIIDFFRAIASTGNDTGYTLARLRWAWTSHQKSRESLAGRFRNARVELDKPGGGYHEWIPTDMTVELLSHAFKAKNEPGAGARVAIQWVNTHHNLRSETHRVYARVLRPASSDRGDRLTEEGISSHAGAAYAQQTGGSGAGLVGQADFHDELRSTFRLGANYGDQPLAFIERLRWAVADLLWDPDSPTGVPSARWDDPLELWFVIERRQAREALTLRQLVARQWENVNAIDADFDRARNNIDG